MTNNVAIGQASESNAASYLAKQGLKCIERNFRCKQGEIDLICLTAEQTLVFVEVRSRSRTCFASAAESITLRKQQRIIGCSRYFLLTHPQYQDCNLRFDVVLFNQQDQPPQWICSAFDASSAY
ncbi:MAG: YraN family protein [Gammaproteobacteria bacterium]|nr:YraN family protein [Gammaproteobacteria bacterium]